MEDESKNVKVPIKGIIEQEMAKNLCKYEEDEFNILRKYFIACLNLGYIEPSNLVLMVDKFCSKIKYIVTNFNSINKLDYYVISNGVIYISGALKDNNLDFYEINLYKAVTETIFASDDNHIGFSNSLCYMVAEKVYNMDENDSRIILPKTNIDFINGTEHKLRSGYSNYDLTITLLKQLLICKNIMENQMIKDMFVSGYQSVLENIFNKPNDELVLTVLDKISLMYINRKTKNSADPSEGELVKKYQIIINGMFEKVNQYYYAFCALVTLDDLRNKFVENMNKE